MPSGAETVTDLRALIAKSTGDGPCHFETAPVDTLLPCVMPALSRVLSRLVTLTRDSRAFPPTPCGSGCALQPATVAAFLPEGPSRPCVTTRDKTRDSVS